MKADICRSIFGDPPALDELVCWYLWVRSETSGRMQPSSSTRSVSKITHIAEGAHNFEMTDACGDGICYQYGASELKIAVNGELGVSSV
jgi:hypothetical protein